MSERHYTEDATGDEICVGHCDTCGKETPPIVRWRAPGDLDHMPENRLVALRIFADDQPAFENLGWWVTLHVCLECCESDTATIKKLLEGARKIAAACRATSEGQ